jgi:transcriptional regulator with XRE-family HTH domain
MKSLIELLAPQRRTGLSLAELPKEIGTRLRWQRTAFNLRQMDLAERAGVSVQTVKAVEKGESISYENLLRMLFALGQGEDFLQMLEAPHFPNLLAQERFVDIKNGKTQPGSRVRAKTQGVS